MAFEDPHTQTTATSSHPQSSQISLSVYQRSTIKTFCTLGGHSFDEELSTLKELLEEIEDAEEATSHLAYELRCMRVDILKKMTRAGYHGLCLAAAAIAVISLL